jgi:outer membrane lipase/esterase
MKHLLRRCAGSLALGFSALCSLPALAQYSSLTVFGDSLSDTGNIFLSTAGATPASPYFNGRFSNGPIWIDTLATGLGLPSGAAPSLGGGSDYAFGGARTGTAASPPGLLLQINGLWAPSHATADATGLYVVVGGGNDLRDARGASSTDSTRQAAAQAAATNVFNAVSALASRGARHVLISNVPDLGNTPEAAALGLVANSTDVTLRYNALIAAMVPTLEASFSGLDVSFLDMAGVATAIRNDALNNGGALYGITNVSTPCGTFSGSIGISCAVSAFSDALHPSAAAHALIGQAALLAVAVPEPGTWLLMALGLVAVAVKRRR